MTDEFELSVNRLFARYDCKKIVILGIGNELRRDDAVGLAVVDRLRTSIDDPSVIVINCQSAPENYTGNVKRIKPTCIVLIDAADFGATPGDARIFQLHDLEGVSVTTHKASLLTLSVYLQSEINCNIFVIGIQPADCDFGSGLTPIARKASIVVADSVSAAINRIRAKKS
ncbi:MAG: hydrogenase 3 maturation endopeptidase HyCI [Halobacteriota archaeon]